MFTYFFDRDFSVTFSRLFLFAFVAMLPFIGGCSEDQNPITDDHEEEETLHADADGVLLKVDGAEVYRQYQETQNGGITLGENDEIEVEVIFLNPNGEEIHLDEIAGEEGEEDEHGHDDEEAFGLAITEYDSAIIEVHLSEEDADHGHAEDAQGEEESELSFEVVGLKAGETTIKLQLLHGDHPDFTALPIPVTVQ